MSRFIDAHRRQGGILFRGQKIGALRAECSDDAVGDALLDHDGLLTRADRAVVEQLRGTYLAHGEYDIGAGVDVDRHVARAHAERGGTRTVGGMHQAGGAGCEDQRQRRMPHQGLGVLAGRPVQPLHAILRRTGFKCGHVTDPRGFTGTRCGAPRGTHDDGVSRLQRAKNLEQHGGCRIGRRYDGEDRTHRLGDLDNAGFIVFMDDADRLEPAQVIVDELRGHHVLEHLVLPAPDPSLLLRHLRQPHACREGCAKDCLDHLVGFFLIELTENTRRRGRPLHDVVDVDRIHR